MNTFQSGKEFLVARLFAGKIDQQEFIERFEQHVRLHSLPAPTDGTTPRTDAETCNLLYVGIRKQPNGDYVPVYFARQLERELALAEKRLGEAQGEAERLKSLLTCKTGAGWGEPFRVLVETFPTALFGNHPRQAAEFIVKEHNETVDSLRAQLATSQARLVEVERERSEYCQIYIGDGEIIDSLRSALAQAKQEGEDLQAKLGASAMFGALGGRLMTRIFEVADMSLENATDVELQLVRLLDELIRLRSQLQAGEADKRRLTEALEFYAGKLREDQNGYEFQREDFTGEKARAALRPPADKPLSAPADSKP